MSVEHSALTVVGYVISPESFFKPFLVRRHEVVHMENRFDSRTGKKLAPEKVIDVHPGWDLVVGNETIAELEDDDLDWDTRELFDHLDCVHVEKVADLVGATGFVSGDYYNGHYVICVEPVGLAAKDGVYLLEDACKFQKEIDRIGNELKKLKIDPGMGGIHAVSVVG